MANNNSPQGCKLQRAFLSFDPASVLLTVLKKITVLEVIRPSAFPPTQPETVKASAQSGLEEHRLLPVLCHKAIKQICLPNPTQRHKVKNIR